VTLHATRVRRDNVLEIIRNPLIAMTEGDGTKRALWLFMSNMTRLETIADRQRRSRVRDLAFAALVVIAGTVSLVSVTQAVRAASVHVVAK
jgi:hypothetical protein